MDGHTLFLYVTDYMVLHNFFEMHIIISENVCIYIQSIISVLKGAGQVLHHH